MCHRRRLPRLDIQRPRPECWLLTYNGATQSWKGQIIKSNCVPFLKHGNKELCIYIIYHHISSYIIIYHHIMYGNCEGFTLCRVYRHNQDWKRDDDLRPLVDSEVLYQQGVESDPWKCGSTRRLAQNHPLLDVYTNFNLCTLSSWNTTDVIASICKITCVNEKCNILFSFFPKIRHILWKCMCKNIEYHLLTLSLYKDVSSLLLSIGQVIHGANSLEIKFASTRHCDCWFSLTC